MRPLHALLRQDHLRTCLRGTKAWHTSVRARCARTLVSQPQPVENTTHDIEWGQPTGYSHPWVRAA